MQQAAVIVWTVLWSVVATGVARAQSGEDGPSPLDDLPPWVRLVTHFGERADWSRDGTRLLFLEKTYGDVFELELETGVIRSMTNHYYHEGYTRALYLSNGDILLSGARTFDVDDPSASRSEENAELWVLEQDKSGPPSRLGTHCSEGPAVSRTRMHIAWTLDRRFYTADVERRDGEYVLANQTEIFDSRDHPDFDSIETQSFRPTDETELTFSAYDFQGSEVMGLDLETGAVVNYSNAPDQYDEPEGIFPDGRHTTVECDAHNPQGIHYNDIYKLALDGSGWTERMTRFADVDGYKATNPVISDDGRWMAFQYARRGDPAGVGRGILVFDIDMWERMKP